MAEDVGSIYYTVDARTEGLLVAEKTVDKSIDRVERSMNRGERASKSLGTTMGQTGRQARASSTEIAKIDGASKRAASGMNVASSSAMRLNPLVAAISTALSVRQITQWADAWTDVQNRLRPVTNGVQNLSTVSAELIRVSNASGVAIENSADLFARLMRSNQQLGASQQQIIQFTDAVNKSLLDNGTNAGGAAALITQLSQAFAGGTLYAQEFNSISDQAPLLLEALQESSGKTRAELKKLGSEGKLSMRQLFQAVLDYSDVIDGRAAQAQRSWSQSVQVSRNNMIAFMGTAESARGVIGAAGDSLVYLSSNIDLVAGAASGLAAVIAGRYASAWGIATVAHFSAAAGALRQVQAERAVASAAIESAKAAHGKSVASMNAVRSTIAEIEADMRLTSAQLATTKGYTQQINLQARLTEMKAAHTAATMRLATAETAVAAAAARSKIAWDANAASLSRMSVVAAAATTVVRGLGAAMSMLGGPVGVALLAGLAIYQFSGHLTGAAQQAERTTQRVNELTQGTENLTAAMLTAKIAEFEADIASMGVTAQGTAEKIAELEEKTRGSFGNRMQNDPSFARMAARGFVAPPAFNSPEAQQSLADSEELNRLRRENDGIEQEVDVRRKAIERLDELRTLRAPIDAINSPAATGSDSEAKRLQREFEAVQKDLSTQRERIQAEYEARNETIRKATSAGSAEQEELLRRSGERRLEEMRQLEQQAQQLVASQSERIVAEYADRERQILRNLEAGSAEQLEALTRNDIQRQQALANARRQELGDLVSHTEAVEAAYAAQQRAILDNTEVGSQQRIEMQKRAEGRHIENILEAQNQDLAVTAQHQQRMRDLQAEHYSLMLQQTEGYSAAVADRLAQIRENVSDPMRTLRENMLETFVSLDDTISSAFVNAVSQGESFNSVLRSIGQTVLAEVLSSFVKLGVQMAIQAALGQSLQAAQAATAAATGSAIAASYAPAAAMVSLASWGANAIPAAAAITSTTALASTMAIAGGRQYGGNVNAGSMYRVTEDGRPEVYSDGTRQYLLPGRNGEVISSREMDQGQGGAQMNVQIYNMGGARVEQEKISPTTIAVWIDRDARANGPIRQAFESNYQTSGRVK